MAFICTICLGFGVAESAQLLDKVVAVVNSNVITATELNTQVELSKKQLAAQKMQIPQGNVLRKQVLQHLIDENLQMQMAKQNNIIVDDTELNEAIDRVAAMNHLDVPKLREELAKQGISWKQYRINIRKEITLSHLQQRAVGKEIAVTNEQVEQYLKTANNADNENLTFHLQNIVIPLNEEPTPAQVKKANASALNLLNKARKAKDFSRLALDESTNELALEGGDLGERHLAELPDIFAKQVVNMKVGQVVGPLRAGNGFQLIKLVAIGGDNQHHVITQTHVRHILLKPDASMLPEESKKQLNNIYQQLKSGKDFAVLAKQYSLDPGSAVKGGDLGWVTAGELVPEFEKTMDKLAPHQVSQPVKSQFGWHIIEVLERKQKDDSIAFKKQQVRQFLQQRKFAEAVKNWQQHLRTDAYVNIVEKDLA